jgi:hypothetical protein
MIHIEEYYFLLFLLIFFLLFYSNFIRTVLFFFFSSFHTSLFVIKPCTFLTDTYSYFLSLIIYLLPLLHRASLISYLPHLIFYLLSLVLCLLHLLHMHLHMHTQMSVSSAATSAELIALMTSRSTQKTNMHPYLPLSPHTRIEGFLVDIATCFYSRVTQIWALREPVPVPIPVPLGPLILPEDDRDDGDDGPLGVIAPPRPGSSVVQLTHIEDMWEDDSDKESDSGAADADADVIDPLAYRIPCPRSSGGMQCVYLQCYVLCAV